MTLKGEIDKTDEENAIAASDSTPLVSRRERLVIRIKGGAPVRALLAFKTPSNLLTTSTYGAVIEAEARALLQLQHPCIPELFEFHNKLDQAYYTIRDLGYESLNSFLSVPAQGSFTFQLAASKRLSEVAKLSLIADCASALSSAHKAGCCHGQLSAADLFIVKERLLLTGFGRPLSSEEPLAADALDAWAPERQTGAPLGQATDRFAWGTFAFRILAGELPFHSSSQSEVGDSEDMQLNEAAIDSGIKALKTSALFDRPEYREFLIALRKSLSFAPEHRSVDLELISSSLQGLLQESPTEPDPSQTSSGAWLSIIKNWRLYAFALFLLIPMAFFWSRGSAIHQQSLPKPPALQAGEISKSGSLQLKVLAKPWAHIFIEGRQVQTTPFARPLVLSPGRHEIILEHPSAPREVRVVEGAEGELITLSVQMRVKKAINWQELEMQAPLEDSP